MRKKNRKPQVVVEQPTPIFHIPTDYRKSAGDGQTKATVIPLRRKVSALAKVGMLASGAVAALGSMTIR